MQIAGSVSIIQIIQLLLHNSIIVLIDTNFFDIECKIFEKEGSMEMNAYECEGWKIIKKVIQYIFIHSLTRDIQYIFIYGDINILL